MAQPSVLVVAAPGRKVRNPNAPKQRAGKRGAGITRAIAVNPNEPYWARRLMFGDVVVTTAAEEAAKAKLAAAKKAETEAAANEATAAAKVAAAAPAPTGE